MLTRPHADSRALAAELGAKLGASAVVSPLLEMRVTGPLPALTPGLVFSSANGVAAYVALSGPQGLAVWCVGARTGQAASKAGLLVQDVAQTADALVALPIGATALTHLHGTHTRGDIAARLSARGIPCTGAAIYDQAPVPLTPQALTLLQDDQRVIAPLFSPRSAALFVAQCPPQGWRNLRIVAISAAVADVVAPHAHDVTVAGRPDGDSMRIALREALGRG